MSYSAFIISFVGGVITAATVIFASSNPQPEVIINQPLPTYTPIPTPTNSPTPTPKPTLTPRPTPTPSPIKPQISYSSEQIYQLIEKYSQTYGVDPNIVRHLGLCESGLNPQAKNYIYGGLFQFSPSTWKIYRQRMGENPDPDLRFDAEAAIKTTAYALSLGQGRLWPNCIP